MIFPGVEELDFVGFLEPLAVANRVRKRRHFDYVLVATERGPINCSGGMKVIPDLTLSELAEHDLLFIPGGGANSSTGVDLLMKNKFVLAKLKDSFLRGHRIWSVCTGALLRGKAGLLKGRQAVTHHAYLVDLKSAGARIIRKRTVTDGRVTTGGGISSSIEVGLKLVQDELGEQMRRRVQTRMEYPPPSSRFDQDVQHAIPSSHPQDSRKSESIGIRVATGKDAKVVSELLRESFAEFKGSYTPRGLAATTPPPSVIRRRMRDGVTWIASIENIAVGTVSAVPVRQDSLYVRSMAVIPSARGRGIARALLKQVEEFARRQGYQRISLSSTPFLKSAIRLYKSSGFRSASNDRGDLFGTPLVAMEKILQ